MWFVSMEQLEPERFQIGKGFFHAGLASGGGYFLTCTMLSYSIGSMTLAGFPRISVDAQVCGGRPVIAGTRVRVTDVLEMLAGGASAEEIVSDFPYLTDQDVGAALGYAAAMADHPVVLAA